MWYTARVGPYIVNLGGKAPGRQVKHTGNHTSGRRRAAVALRRADEQTTSARRRSDVDYCRYGGRRTDVGLTSVCLVGLASCYVEVEHW